MKIVYVYPHFVILAGTERVLIDKMNFLAEEYGYDVFLVTNEQGNHPFSYPLSPKVRHIDLGVRYTPLYQYNKFLKFFKWQQNDKSLQKHFDEVIAKIKPDIVIATTYHSNLLSIVSNCPLKYVRLLESHIDKRYILNNDPHNKKNFLRWLNTYYQMMIIKRNARKFDLLVALTDSDAEEWARYLKTTVISNVVHLNPTGRTCDYSSKRVIFVGRYKEQKGVFDLLDIWKIAYKNHQDWHLDLYGDGYLGDNLKREANRLNMNIHVNDPSEKIFDRYLSSSIFVLTSEYEPFGLVMPEAMSCGLPVVAFDCPSGPSKIIKDGDNGFLISNRDKQLFADKLGTLMDSRELCERMGRKAVISSQNYAPDKVMPLWKDLFESLVIGSQK